VQNGGARKTGTVESATRTESYAEDAGKSQILVNLEALHSKVFKGFLHYLNKTNYSLVFLGAFFAKFMF
jgi:hypothetical protein